MIHHKTETEARNAVKAVLKRFPGAHVHEIHVDSATDHNWYILIKAPPPDDRVLYRCKWSSPIIRFK